MRTYIVFKKDDDVKVVADSVSLKAAIFNVIWILYHRLWHLLLIFALYITSVYYIGHFNFINGNFGSFLFCLALPYLWVYGNYWRQRKFLRKGYLATGVVTAKNYDEALYKAL